MWKRQHLKGSSLLMGLALLALAFAFSLLLRSNPWSHVLPGHDSSMFIYMGREWVQGGVPYLSFTDHKGPSIMLVNALGWLLPHVQRFGGIWWVEVTSLFFYALWGFKTLRLFLDRSKSYLVVVLSFLLLAWLLSGGNITEIYALPAIMGTLFLYFSYFKRGDLRFSEYFLLGLGGAFTFNLRANMIVSWLPLLAFILGAWLLHKDWAALKRGFLGIFIGIFAYVLPWVAYLAYKGALGEMLYFSITFNWLYVSAGQVDRWAVFLDWLTTPFGKRSAMCLCLGLLGGSLAFLIQSNKSRHFFISLGFFLSLALTFLSAFLSGRLYAHYFIPLVPYLLVLLGDFLRPFEGRRWAWLLNCGLWAGALYFCLPQGQVLYDDFYMINAATPVSQLEAAVRNTQPKQDIYPSKKLKKRTLKLRQAAANYEKIGALLKRELRPDDTIYVHRRGGALYLMQNHPAPVRYFNLPAMDLRQNRPLNEEFIKSFQAHPPKSLIFEDKFLKDASKDGPLEQFLRQESKTVYKKLQKIGAEVIFEHL